MRGTLFFAAIALLGAFATGCGSDEKPQAKSADKVTTSDAPRSDAPKARGDTATPTSGSIQIDDKIAKACGNLPETHFAFDSAQVQPTADAALDALARCFTSGPLKGRAMRLIGHADPRGETEYNFALGQKRAGSVGEYLERKGMDKGKVQSTSKGALEATGTDEDGWARDRKVEVVLAD